MDTLTQTEFVSILRRASLFIALLLLLTLLLGSVAVPPIIKEKSSIGMVESIIPTEYPPRDSRQSPVSNGRSTPLLVEKPQAILLDEGFEGGVVPPSDWALYMTNVSHSWKIEISGAPYSGSKAADVEYDPSLAPQNEWLLNRIPICWLRWRSNCSG
jgi:hypothetical protein